MNRVKELLANDAVIIDVRTPQEFQGGHVAGSKNIPLDQLETQLDAIRKMNSVVLCCASGMRSGRAASYLKSQEINCENGGSWMSVNGMI